MLSGGQVYKLRSDNKATAHSVGHGLVYIRGEKNITDKES